MGIFVYASTATGKSTCGKKYKNVIDMESTIYKYLNNSEEKEAIKGNKDRKLNPDWPSNYFKKLEEVKDKYDYILISDEVCNEFLLKNNYEYWWIYPSLELKEEYLKRCKDRGNTQDFIDYYNNLWEEWYHFCKNDTNAMKKIELKQGQYVEDVLDNLKPVDNKIRKLTIEDTNDFCNLIVDMYSHLENLEWFSPMPYDYENVKSMIENPRFYIIGYFDNDKLCGVGSLDYKCGKLIGKVDFPSECNVEKLVELGFHMVHSDYRGQGIMKIMVEYLLNELKVEGYEWAFGKVHKDNFASSKSLMKKGFEIFSDYAKPVKIVDFVELSSKDFFSKKGKDNAKLTLSKYNENDEKIIVDYNILVKKL